MTSCLLDADLEPPGGRRRNYTVHEPDPDQFLNVKMRVSLRVMGAEHTPK